jgi:TRAP-type uncharacterized transport system substrate-binding protein
MKTFGPAVLITLIGFVIAYQFVNPAPPDTIVIATGTEEGAYYLFARRYREQLAADGITLELRNSVGSVENLHLLEGAADPVDLAFVQGGVATADSTALVSMGSLYYEPLWVFYRGEQDVTRLSELLGKRFAIGEEGSGTRAVALSLLKDYTFDAGADTLLALGGRAAAQALLNGEVDAALFVAAPDAPLIQELLYANTIRLMSFARSEAYARRYRFLSAITLPEGVIDFDANIPARDTRLLAPTANLVARRDFHPALVSLVLQAASRVHGDGDLFVPPGTFPAPRYLDLELDEDARRYYEHGPPFLQRYLPFWAASLVDRLKIMLVPLVTLLIPLFKIMPPAYRWQVRKKIYRWYRELQVLDIVHPEAETAARLDEYLGRLDAIEDEVRKVAVPLSYADELYNLRLHLGLVRERLQGARTGLGG